MVLRNVVPRQGTETKMQDLNKATLTIEKCSSPTGDGNFLHLSLSLSTIEKCSSPTGDGNYFHIITIMFSVLLRNVVPRQGTETIFTSS